MAKTYSIGEVSKLFHLSVPTLRYYDQEGLIPNLKKEHGVRRFNQDNIEAIEVIECLKASGMPLKEVKYFMALVQKGDETLAARLQLMRAQRAQIEKEMSKLKNALAVIDYKCDYYRQAVSDGTEQLVKKERSLTSFLEERNILQAVDK
jgi:DNA-binding transcriptional MerR regulator